MSNSGYPLNGQWLPAESVEVLSYKQIGAREFEKKFGRYHNGLYQVYSSIVRSNKSGDLLVSTITAGDPGWNVLMRSKDNGQTWSRQEYAWNQDSDDGSNGSFVYLTSLRSGRLLAIWLERSAAWGEYPTNSRVMYSDDDGITWTLTRYPINTKPFKYVIYSDSRIHEDYDGTLAMVFYGPKDKDAYITKTGEWASALLRSYDGGMTWGAPSVQISLQTDHSFQSKAISDFSFIRSPVSLLSDHSFQF